MNGKMMTFALCVISMMIVSEASPMDLNVAKVIALRDSLGETDGAVIEDLEKELAEREEGESPADNENAVINPCLSNPCREHGICSAAETPLLELLNINYWCRCKRYTDPITREITRYGGFFCQIENPCNSCPEGMWKCTTTSVDEDGRYCYSEGYRTIIDETTNLFPNRDRQ